MRRSQITLYMILGLAMLMAVLLAIGLLTDWYGLKPPEEIQLCEIPTQLAPLENAVSQCQLLIAREGAKKLLSNGGYIDPLQSGIVPVITPYGNAFSPFEDKIIPYWRYIDNGLEKSAAPPLDYDTPLSIKNQLERYIDERIDSCVPWDDFAEYNINRKEPRTTVFFSEDDIEVVTDWEIETDVSDCGTKSFFSFSTIVDAPIKRLYDVAYGTVLLLRDYKQLELLTIDWLGIYANGLGSLPPLFGTVSFSNKFRVYPLDSAKQELDEVITMLSDSVQLGGSKRMQAVFNSDPVVDDLRISAITPPVSGIDRMSFNSFYYPGTSYLAINGNLGAAIPKIISIPVPLIGSLFPKMVDETYRYDVVYPLQFRFEQDGYVLNVGYEVNIKANKPDNGTIPDASYEHTLCDNPGGSDATIRVNPDIPATISFSCAGEVCPLGDTFNGELKATLPACAEGSLEAITDDYFSDVVSVTSSAGNDIDVTIDLYEPKKTRISVKGYNIKLLSDDSMQVSDNPVDVRANVVLLRHGKPYFVSPGIDGTADMVPGVYDVFIINVTEFDPPVEIEKMVITGGVVINGTNFSFLPTVYLSKDEDKAVNIPVVPDNLVIEAFSLSVIPTANGLILPDISTYDDLSLLSGLFLFNDNSSIYYIINGDKGTVKIRMN